MIASSEDEIVSNADDDLEGRSLMEAELKQLLRHQVLEVELSQACSPILALFMQRLADHILTWAIQEEKCLSQATRDMKLVPQRTSNSDGVSPLPPPAANYLLTDYHPHSLQLFSSVNDEDYRCDLCGHSGRQLVYSCRKCDFDLHPSCFVAVGGIDPHSTPVPNPDDSQERYPPDAAERIELHFPPQIARQLPTLLDEAVEYRWQMISSVERNTHFTAFSLQTLQYLLNEYNHKKVNPSPPLTLTPVESSVCLVLLDVLVSRVIRQSLMRCGHPRRPTIRPFDLLLGILSDAELSVLTKYLNAPFDVNSPHHTLTATSSSTAHWPTTPNENIKILPPYPFSRSTRFEAMLDETFQENVEQFQEINADEWYFNPDQVKQYAQQYAELTLPPGDDYFYRQYGITPIAFYGGTNLGLFTLNDEYDREERVCTFSLLNDAQESIQFCLAIRSSDIGFGCTLYDMTHEYSAVDFGSSNPEAFFTDEWVTFLPSSHQIERPLLQLPTFHKPHISLTYERISEDWRGVWEWITTHLKPNSIRKMTDERKPLPKIQQFQIQSLIALQLFAYELYPTGLWTANHPLSVRHYFTQELIREQSRLAGLPELPNDLLHLIGEYEPAQLPCPSSSISPLLCGAPSPLWTPAELLAHQQKQRYCREFIALDAQIET